jgi:hypothetical protein
MRWLAACGPSSHLCACAKIEAQTCQAAKRLVIITIAEWRSCALAVKKKKMLAG